MRRTLWLWAVLLCAACTAPVRPADTQSYTDDYDRTVQVPTHPQRIVSTSPAVTEILFALGAEGRLVGRTDFCTYPPEAESIESIGGISNLNVEKIASLHPDLVISGSMIPRKSTDLLDRMGIPIVCVVEQPYFVGLFGNITKIGQLVGCAEAADSLNQLLEGQAKGIVDSLKAIPKAKTWEPPSVYYVVGYGASGNFTAGGNSFINDMITLAGGRNIAADVTGWSYSLEALMEADPDYILIRREDSAAFCKAKPYRNLSAVKEGRVVAIESGTIDLQVPRNLQAVQLLARVFSGRS